VAAFKAGTGFISEHAKSPCAIVHCAFRRSFQTIVSHCCPRDIQHARIQIRRFSDSGIGRRRGWRSFGSSHRQFVGHAARQFVRPRWFTGLVHWRRYLRPWVSRRVFLWGIRRPPGLDRRVLLRLDRHFALSGNSIRCVNGAMAAMFPGRFYARTNSVLLRVLPVSA
jgi:hypothetical protein